MEMDIDEFFSIFTRKLLECKFLSHAVHKTSNSSTGVTRTTLDKIGIVRKYTFNTIFSVCENA